MPGFDDYSCPDTSSYIKQLASMGKIIDFIAPAPAHELDHDEETRRMARAEKYGTNRAAESPATSSQPPVAHERSSPGSHGGRRGGAGRGAGRRARGRGHVAPSIPGMTLGFEMFSEEEVAKRSARAERFGMAADEPDLLTGLRVRVAPVTEAHITLKRRSERFGLPCTPADTTLIDQDLLEKPKNVDVTVDRRVDTIHVYGVDLMSTQDVKQYFQEYEPQRVEWINDSSCNVRFKDTLSACRAIVGLGEALAAEEAPDQGGLSVMDVDISQAAYMWHKSQVPFRKGDADVPLLFRIASILDVKDPTAKERSRYLWKTPHAIKMPSADVGDRKRSRVDADGDVVMGNGDGEDGPRRKARGRRQVAPASFLDDSDRVPVSDVDLQMTLESDPS